LSADDERCRRPDDDLFGLTMANVLVMLVMPEEQITMGALVIRRFRGRFPAIGPESIWQPPPEPWRERGPYWFESARAHDEHTHAVSQSLEMFLNDKLMQLDGVVGSGNWTMEYARASVSLRAAPQRLRGR
jgi:hypothetical protein